MGKEGVAGHRTPAVSLAGEAEDKRSGRALVAGLDALEEPVRFGYLHQWAGGAQPQAPDPAYGDVVQA